MLAFSKHEKHFQKTKSPHLGSDDEKPTSEKGDLPPVKGFNNGDYANTISRAIPKSASGISKDGNENMLLHVKGTRVERKGSRPETRNPELGGGEDGGQEMANGEGGDLNGDLSNDEGLSPVGEELVEEGEESA